ncbi:hypothetical protein B0H17DRAFT_1139932 [Mycena rosella]|uniref:Uncharacterized protein n=1 Tax=Mycena rosella TaxID=1033263 RepID=A0AAD7D376_MYCRO|nr:hypothetical protein B0H17DRAFT_1139932 [Mycena rosella]
MSGVVDKVEGAAENKLGQDAQPGDGIERTADNDINQGVDQVANDSGVPQQDDNTINEVADRKVNEDIPVIIIVVHYNIQTVALMLDQCSAGYFDYVPWFPDGHTTHTNDIGSALMKTHLVHGLLAFKLYPTFLLSILPLRYYMLPATSSS